MNQFIDIEISAGNEVKHTQKMIEKALHYNRFLFTKIPGFVSANIMIDDLHLSQIQSISSLELCRSVEENSGWYSCNLQSFVSVKNINFVYSVDYIHPHKWAPYFNHRSLRYTSLLRMEGISPDFMNDIFKSVIGADSSCLPVISQYSFSVFSKYYKFLLVYGLDFSIERSKKMLISISNILKANPGLAKKDVASVWVSEFERYFLSQLPYIEQGMESKSGVNTPDSSNQQLQLYKCSSTFVKKESNTMLRSFPSFYQEPKYIANVQKFRKDINQQLRKIVEMYGEDDFTCIGNILNHTICLQRMSGHKLVYEPSTQCNFLNMLISYKVEGNKFSFVHQANEDKMEAIQKVIT
jgi:hypothetical protein